jgi:hypothetical protein
VTRLHYLTASAVESLREGAAEHVDWYYSPDGAFPGDLPVKAIRDARIDIAPLASALEEGGLQHDAKNALAVYATLRDLTPHQASDERLWVHLAHFECAPYIADRWLRSRPEGTELAARKVRNHFFARGGRGLLRDGGISRLWWLGHIAHQAHPKEPERFLDIVLHRQDVRSALLDRTSISLNPAVLGAIFAVMQSHWDADSKEREAPLFERDVFRTWMAGLDRRGGIVLLDALPAAELRRVVRLEAERALEADADGGQPQP